MRRVWPLRIRLTLAFASVVALVLAACALLIYVQFARFIDNRTDEELRERAVTFRALGDQEVVPRRIVELAGEEFAQIYDRHGTLVATTRTLGRQRLLTAAQIQRARTTAITANRSPTRPTDDGVRLRAFVLDDDAVAVIADPRDDRERELGRLALLLGLAMPGALLLASLTGYQVAGAALRPVERMRARAAAIGDSDPSGRLDQPHTNDELDRLASTLNDLLARLQDALVRERRIVSDASHELRTPIAVLRARLEVALRSDADLRAAVQEAHGDTVRLSRLAEDLLVLARADRGELPLRREPIEAQDLLERAVARHGSDARPVTWEVAIPGGAVLLADPDRVDQVLDNLLANALRHGAGTVTLTATQAGEQIRLTVTDHGDGFAPALLDRAFERFSHGEHSGGSGLGLAIVSALVSAHGGTVSAQNTPGATVAVTFPAA